MKIKGKTFQKIKRRAALIHAARNKRDKRRNDIRGPYNCIVGIIGEIIAWKKSKIGNVDLKIYKDGHKKRNFDGDLAPHVHVKTCNLKFKDNKTFDSWTVDKSDPIYTNPSEKDIILLVYADAYKNFAEGYFVGYVNAVDINKFWKPTKKIPHKVAIYYNDIKEHIFDIKKYINNNSN